MEERGGNARLALAIALLALVMLVVLVLALNGGGDDDDPIRAERVLGPGPTEVLVYVSEERNGRGGPSGRNPIELECADARGKVVMRGRHPWPFVDTDDGITEPHVHQFALPDQVRAVKRCRLRGTDLAADVVDQPIR